MMLRTSTTTTGALFAVFGSIANAKTSNMRHPLLLNKLPDTGEGWSSLSNGVQVQPASQLSPLAQDHWRRLTNANATEDDEYDSSIAYQTLFVDGTETYYDEYAQAWRALGFYIDCDYDNSEGQNEEGQQNNGNNNNDNNGDNSGCTRFLLWAAYIDESYQGNGMAEYQYYDRHNERWDDSACNSTRCAKMDCHLEDTHYALLGYFKEPQYDTWMTQLFSTEGDCLWTDDEYRFMQGHLSLWPMGCTESDYETEDGETIYYDLKPTPYGEMDIGLYLDDSCIESYTGDLTPEIVLKTMVCDNNENDALSWMCATNYTDYEYGAAAYQESNETTTTNATASNSPWSLEDSVKRWNDAFNVYKQCQPCKTFDLTGYVAGYQYEANANGDRYGDWIYQIQTNNNNNNNGDGDNAEGEGDQEQQGQDTFRCHDDANNYGSVNQCMKFRAKTNMMTAKWNDVQLGAIQGTVTTLQSPNTDGTSNQGQGQFPFGLQYNNNNNNQHWGKEPSHKNQDETKYLASLAVVLASSVLFGCSLYRWIVAKEELAEAEAKAPLMANPNSVSA